MFLKESAKNSDIKIPECGTWQSSVHELDEESWWAINAALASRRPLLLRGLPGTGKSQMARAAAAALKRAFLPIVVNAKMESQDLLFDYDAVHRLADAQTAAMQVKEGQKLENALKSMNPKNYLRPKALWWGFNWSSALALTQVAGRPPLPTGADPTNGAVVLIDEIDKADVDLPNGLLETLGNGGFSVPIINDSVTAKGVFPLVVVTTNEDRELPPAFVRRCLVHHLSLPVDPDALIELMVRRGGMHFGKLSKRVRQKAAELLVEDREMAKDHYFIPGQAEYIDVLRALNDLGKNANEHLAILEQIRQFTFGKHAEQAHLP